MPTQLKYYWIKKRRNGSFSVIRPADGLVVESFRKEEEAVTLMDKLNDGLYNKNQLFNANFFLNKKLSLD